ncbi:MAG: hypothetical protein ACM3JB_13675 [Acidobacteriaceae bacterium]
MVKLIQDHTCTSNLAELKATAESPYHFTDAGLPNVYLSGIKYFICEVCQQIVRAEIPAIKELLDAIARAVVTKQSPLKGVEVKFLRKRLGMRAIDFAKIIDTTPEQLSRFENEHNGISGTMDRFIRLVYAFIKKDAKLKTLIHKVQEEFEKWSTSIHEFPTGERIVAEFRANKKWIAETECAAAA